MSYSLKELRNMDDKELIEQHDNLAEHTSVGVSYYLDELARRDSEKINKTMLRCTKCIMILTIVTTLATLANLHFIVEQHFISPDFYQII